MGWSEQASSWHRLPVSLCRGCCSVHCNIQPAACSWACAVACPLCLYSSKSRTHHQSAFCLVFLKYKPVSLLLHNSIHSHSTLVSLSTGTSVARSTVMADFQALCRSWWFCCLNIWENKQKTSLGDENQIFRRICAIRCWFFFVFAGMHITLAWRRWCRCSVKWSWSSHCCSWMQTWTPRTISQHYFQWVLLCFTLVPCLPSVWESDWMPQVVPRWEVCLVKPEVTWTSWVQEPVCLP